MMRIRIKIGKMVLHGFEYHDHRQIEAAIVRELSRLVREEKGLMQDHVMSKEIPKIGADVSFSINGHEYSGITGAAGKVVQRAWNNDD